MTQHSKVSVRRGKSQRLVGVFSQAQVFEASDPASPLHGSLRGSLEGAVVITDGKRHQCALRSELVFG